MGERKVLNKYIPWDFDPADLPRVRNPKDGQRTVRMMLPMSVRCSTCGNYMSAGTKFNTRMEDVKGMKYLGIQIYRFYFKCSKCSAEFTVLTDPQNSDYTVERGAKRNFEPWRAKDEALEKSKRKQEADEMGDPLKKLENRAVELKQEMDIMAALDELKSVNARRAQVDTADILKALKRASEDEEDEAIVKSIVFKNSPAYVKRLPDVDEEDETKTSVVQKQVSPVPKRSERESLKRLKPLFKRKPAMKNREVTEKMANSLSALAQYDSD